LGGLEVMKGKLRTGGRLGRTNTGEGGVSVLTLQWKQTWSGLKRELLKIERKLGDLSPRPDHAWGGGGYEGDL